MPRFLASALLSLALVAPVAGLAHDYAAGDLAIAHPYARAVAPSARASAGYLEIRNTGTQPDRLLSVEAEAPRVELHTVETGDDGVTRMVPLADGLVVLAGETVALAPGGSHVMFMGVTGSDFAAGESVTATLVFERAGRVEVQFSVEDLTEAETQDAMGDGTDHDGMDHEAHHADPDHEAIHRQHMEEGHTGHMSGEADPAHD